jgi:hypothetical protein
MKTMICRKYSFQKLTQLSHGNNVLDSAASTIGGFLWRDKFVYLTQLNRPIWKKGALFHLQNYDLQEVFL